MTSKNKSKTDKGKSCKLRLHGSRCDLDEFVGGGGAGEGVAGACPLAFHLDSGLRMAGAVAEVPAGEGVLAWFGGQGHGDGGLLLGGGGCFGGWGGCWGADYGGARG